MNRALRFLILSAMPAVFAACALPPSEVGPPPVPKDAPPETVTDSSDEPPAPVLPDPRADLPPAPTEVTDAPEPEPEPTPAPQTYTPSPSSYSPSGTLTESVWSVQVFAASTRENADGMARRLEAEVREPVDVVQESDGMWRVYVGRSASREPIDTLRDRLRRQGFDGAWTRQRQAETSVADNSVAPGESVYSVQVFASEDAANARRVADEVRGRTSMQVEAVQAGGVWKVLVGRSASRGAIDAERDRLRRSGYPDAWTLQREGY